jgi:hypothetical protein
MVSALTSFETPPEAADRFGTDLAVSSATTFASRDQQL